VELLSAFFGRQAGQDYPKFFVSVPSQKSDFLSSIIDIKAGNLYERPWGNLKMLIIRKDQMDALGKYMLEKYVERSSATLEGRFPEQTKDMSHPELNKMIHACIQKARQYNIIMEADVFKYLEYCMLHGPEFCKKPEFSKALETLKKDIDGTAKMILLSEYMESSGKETA
jgi:hypothetical protein